MIDLANLRPRDDTPSAIADALSRCNVAARGLAATINRLREARVGLLLRGTYADLTTNGNDLSRALQDGHALDELIDSLRAMQRSVAIDPAAVEVTARLEMLLAVQTMADWWAQHGPQITTGLALCSQAADKLAVWKSAADRVAEAFPPTPPSNVTPLGPRPAA